MIGKLLKLSSCATRNCSSTFTTRLGKSCAHHLAKLTIWKVEVLSPTSTPTVSQPPVHVQNPDAASTALTHETAESNVHFLTLSDCHQSDVKETIFASASKGMPQIVWVPVDGLSAMFGMDSIVVSPEALQNEQFCLEESEEKLGMSGSAAKNMQPALLSGQTSAADQGVVVPVTQMKAFSLPLASISKPIDASTQVLDQEFLQENSEEEDALPLNEAERELMESAQNGNVSGMLSALGKGASIHRRHTQHGATALHLAAGCWDDDVALAAVKILVNLGANPSAQAFNGSTALHWSSGIGNAKTVEFLTSEASTDTFARTSTWKSTVFGQHSGQNPLHWAADAGHHDVAKALVHQNPLLVAEGDDRHGTAAQRAASSGHDALQNALQQEAEREYVAVRVSLEAQKSSLD